MKNDYIENHDFGYGKGPLKKIKLRDVQDCKDYVKDVMKNAFVEDFSDNTIFFGDEKSKVQVSIEKNLNFRC